MVMGEEWSGWGGGCDGWSGGVENVGMEWRGGRCEGWREMKS